MALAISNIPVLTGRWPRSSFDGLKKPNGTAVASTFPVNTRNVRRLSGRIGFVWLS